MGHVYKTVKWKSAKTIELTSIRIDDRFWNKYTNLVTSQVIPYQWKTLNDQVPDAEPSHCIENFRIAAGESQGDFYGAVFQDSDLAKWLEAVAYSLSYESNPELERQADEVIDLIERVQQPDGYMDTYFIIKEPKHKFANLREGHELYCAGHMMEAAVAYYQVTGKDKLLSIMRKCADLICDTLTQEAYEGAVPGHQEIEIGLIKMFRVTGERRYLDMAKKFICRRGQSPNYLAEEHKKENWIDIFKDPNPFLPEYYQCHKPVHLQDTAEGHSVRAVYMYCAMADLAYEYRDEALLEACEKLYNNIVQKRMYITGGIGSSGAYERFTTDYDLPNDCNYAESCASIGLALFCRRMAQITGEEKYVDTMERALMNTVLAGISMDGKSFFYVNPLEVWPDNCLNHTSMAHVMPVRQKWFGVACCPPNIARTLASLGEYVAFHQEDKLWLNLYVGGKIQTTLGRGEVQIQINTKMPFKGETEIIVTADEKAHGSLMLRIPVYAERACISCNKKYGNPSAKAEGSLEPGTYYEVPITAGSGTYIIGVTFHMPAHFVYANPQVRADAGKAALMKGPLVYCAEEIDNDKNLAGLFYDVDSYCINEQWEENLLGGTIMITIDGCRLDEDSWTGNLYGGDCPKLKPVRIKMIPYCHWGNREPGEMTVWGKIRRSL